MYFKMTFSNGYCGCDETIYIKTDTTDGLEEWAADYLNFNYAWVDPGEGMIGDYDNEEEYFDAVDRYREDCTYTIEDCTEEEYIDNDGEEI